MNLRPLTLVGIILSIVTGLSLGILAHLHTRTPATLESTETLRQALDEVSSHYVHEISEEDLLRYAIDGMMQRLDEHSDYLDTSAYDDLQATTTGRFGGIGLELGLVDEFFTVISPIDDTPAARAGVRAGDRIVKLEGDPVKGMKLRDLIDELRGEAGSEVTFTVYRQDDDRNHDFTLTRQTIKIASVRGRLLTPGVGYLRISQFQTATSADVASTIERLVDEEGGALEGLVIDLRNNPGGTLQSSVEVADHFLESGLIVSTSGRLPSSAAKYRATRGDLLNGKPIVVLINKGSASASEILASSLKDHDRAVIMGTTSYGKGSVQTVVPLEERGALKLTTAYYYSPSGATINELGVAPDVHFEGSDEALLDEAVQVIRQASPDELQARLGDS